MNTTHDSAVDLAAQVGEKTSIPGVRVAVFPPFPYLIGVGAELGEVLLGAQDVYHQSNGAYTGEVSIEMLKDCGVSVVLAGHSERRHVIGESDELINKKVAVVLNADLMCVLCIGETLEQRHAGMTNLINEQQLRAGLAGVTDEQMARVVIAYEPVWAIGTGKTATPADAQEAHNYIRGVLKAMFNAEIAQATVIQYGGSVKPVNAVELFGQPDIDGGLIGGASLNADDFGQIVAAAAQV